MLDNHRAEPRASRREDSFDHRASPTPLLPHQTWKLPTGKMKLAEVLSDLNTLRVCDRSTAMALVSARPTPPSQTNIPPTSDTQSQVRQEQDQDKDIQRAKDLLRLHYDVKVAHQHGKVDQGLLEARRMVKAALEEIDDAVEEGGS